MNPDFPKVIANDEDASRLLRQIEEGSLDADAAYMRLVGNEQDTLRLLNRVVETTNRNRRRLLFHQMTITEMVMNTLAAWKHMLLDVSDGSNATFDGLTRVLWDQDRKIYSGLLLVFIALASYFVDISM